MARVGNSTLGMTFGYAAESTAGTRPTTGYTKIPVKDIPDIANSISSIDVTELLETFARQYTGGLHDTDGVIGLTANNTDAIQSAWAGCVSAFAALTGDKGMWFCIDHPSLANAFYLKGEPVAPGFSGASVNEALNLTLNVIVEKVEGWAAKPTA